MSGFRFRLRLGFLVTVMALFALFPASAREWERLDRPPFQILYVEGNGSEAERLAAEASKVLAELEQNLGLPSPREVTVKILPPARAASETTAPHWAVAYVPGGTATVVLRGDLIRTYPFADLLSLFAHEMTHVLLNALPPPRGRLPRWFHEGVAVMESRRWSFRDAFALGATLLIRNPAPLARLTNSFPEDRAAARAAYAASFSFVSYLEQEHGPGAIRRILEELEPGTSFPRAFLQAVGTPLSTVERDWQSRVTWLYRWVPALTSSSVLWMGITVLVVLSRVAKRRREQRIQEEWEREGIG